MSLLRITTHFPAGRFLTSSFPKMMATRSFAIGDQLQSKKKVEEDRYIREQERKFFEKKKMELESKLHEETLKEFESTVAPAMAEVEALLKTTGDKVSDEGLELLAKWKLEMKYD